MVAVVGDIAMVEVPGGVATMVAVVGDGRSTGRGRHNGSSCRRRCHGRSTGRGRHNGSSC